MAQPDAIGSQQWSIVMDRKPEIQELSAAEVDQVTGGLIITALAGALARAALKGSQGDLPSGGGQNDPAQMFQQIMQQLTSG
jgi:hypothetical protein